MINTIIICGGFAVGFRANKLFGWHGHGNIGAECSRHKNISTIAKLMYKSSDNNIVTRILTLTMVKNAQISCGLTRVFQGMIDMVHFPT